MTTKAVGATLGVLCLAAVLLLPPPGGVPLPAWNVAGVMLLMAIWWVTEVVPIPVTALLPLVLFPLLGVSTPAATALSYGDPVIFLFLGGFVIGLAMQRWQLHRRVGLHILNLVGVTPGRLLLGMLLSTGLVSMWVSNSASAIIMLPVALSVVALLDAHGELDEASRRNLGTTLVLAVAYGASIGGLGTLIGSPPNALLAAYLAREHGIELGFVVWMLLALPLVAVLLVGSWAILGWLHPVRSGERDAGPAMLLRDELESLGPLVGGERTVAVVFGAVALAWALRPLYSGVVAGIDDSTIAVAAAIVLFLLPNGLPEGGRLLVWEDVKGLPWGVLILFGGGLGLASAISASGLATWLGGTLAGLSSLPAVLVVAAATVGMIFFTEVTSNTASAAALLPIGGAVAVAMGLDPGALTVPLALAASCGFMLPVGTPPNAIVFASGHVTVGQMARAGLLINLLAAAAIVLVAYPLAGWVLGGQ